MKDVHLIDLFSTKNVHAYILRRTTVCLSCGTSSLALALKGSQVERGKNCRAPAERKGLGGYYAIISSLPRGEPCAIDPGSEHGNQSQQVSTGGIRRVPAAAIFLPFCSV